MRLGVLGGSFNPFHKAHLQVAIATRDQHELDRVLLMPAAQPPHKDTDLAPPRSRLAMVEIATADIAGLEGADLELQRAGPSYTVDTLVELKRQHPGVELFFVMGSDSLLDFHSWRQPERILELARIVVVHRPGFDFRSQSDEFHHFSEDVLLRIEKDQVKMPPSDINSTTIREAIRSGTSVAEWVPPGVLRYIEEHGLYSQ